MENEVADLSAQPSISEDVKAPEQNTPADTAAAEVVEPKQAEPERKFTQAELDAAIQKRLLKRSARYIVVLSNNCESRLKQKRERLSHSANRTGTRMHIYRRKSST